jgi:hypothetical protein
VHSASGQPLAAALVAATLVATVVVTAEDQTLHALVAHVPDLLSE